MCLDSQDTSAPAPPPPAPPPVSSGDLKITALKDKKKSQRTKKRDGKQGLRSDLNLNINNDSGGSGLTIQR